MFTREVVAEGFNWINIPPTPSLRDTPSCRRGTTAKVRYRQPDQRCSIEVQGDRVKATFEKPQRAVTPGQWLVLYDGDVCLGGGVIQ